ncbi:hypothetical protein [Paenibacillus silviterrae]|uniref:hypothetical protein n=1 Tax=Paenibacillus silviterrae TaxID=3242194 RepID=UPI00254355B3|nr:hypothetical protein [Paenibacillus chinjuensis]
MEATYVGGYVLPEDATEETPSTLPKPLEFACILFAQTLLRTPELLRSGSGISLLPMPTKATNSLHLCGLWSFLT